MDKLNKIISNTFKITEEQIKDDFGPNDIEKWDSLLQIVLISTIESEYKITFEIEDILRIMKIGDIRSILKEKLERKK